MKLILLGAPGAGKGTQAEIISEKLGIPAISTGNIIRDAVKSGTPAGLAAKSYMDAGVLVPDEAVIAIVKERIGQEDCKDGFILDGYPRTLPQAQELDAMGLVIDKVIYLDVPDDRLMRRLENRRVCGDCGASYNLKHIPPRREGICDRCGGELITRPDDNPETVRERLRVYHEQTEPLKDYYHAAGKLILVKGQKDVDETAQMTLMALGAGSV